ncbi:MAG TPA: hypothetical protein PLI79_12155 [Mycobacterium sp.]|nr:hypothetical protein [Mycobacterium sp.]MCB0946217.1 hypothetical protein [Mycobacterium sp.]TXI40823.1 MAG: hypothetical protein E6Q57_18230 [Mycobacterium sp.]HMZ14259.1 hypothetical protein [Mycobacterium sp.]HNA50325.1 hypothetical protein [Mycobacterium sp.]
MSDISERRIVCLSCTQTIDVSVLVVDGRETIAVHAVEEILVDYGWLPTPRGSYCPQHARSVRHDAG